MNEKVFFRPPRVLAWEVTRRCPLKCRHCRAGAADVADARELTTEECRRVLDSLAAGSVPAPVPGAVPAPAPGAVPRPGHPPGTGPLIIWTGGEPMSRPDIVELVSYATSRGLASVLAPCGMLVTAERLRELKAAGVRACSFSLDGPDAATHDAFRGVPGAYAHVTRAMRLARACGMPFQVNVTVSTLNLDRLEEIYDQAVDLGAAKLDLFFLVPVGRGRGLADYALSSEQTRRVLDWAFAKAAAGPLALKETCCPSAPVHWAAWRKTHMPSAASEGGLPSSAWGGCSPASLPPPCGCLGGRGFAFLSHVGDLQTCGFIDVPCGNIRDFGCDFPALIAAAVNPLGRRGTCRGREE